MAKKLKIIFCVSLCVALLAIPFSAFADGDLVFAGGAGTPDDPWQIENADQLLAINNNLTASYILTSDIDLTGYENPVVGKYVMDPESEEGEDPVFEMAFSGSFDGDNHTISNLTIDRTEDFENMFGVGLFSCVTSGGVVKNVTLKDLDVKGMMLVGGAVGYAFHCTVDNVNLTATDRNTVESTMIMAGGVIGGLTLSECVNCDVEKTDIIAAPGGNSGILGGGFSKPVLENCTVSDCTLTAELGEVPMFGMTEGMWIGGLTGCVNLDDYDPNDWYVKNCSLSDVQIFVNGTGSYVGGLTGSCGVTLENQDSSRMLIQNCKLENVELSISGSIKNVGGMVGGGFTEGEEPRSFLIDTCYISNMTMITDTESLEESAIGLVIGLSHNDQFMGLNGEIVGITDQKIDVESINSTIGVQLMTYEGTAFADAAFVGQIFPWTHG